jgi:hypothetical protein
MSRKNKLKSLTKLALGDQHGVFQHFQSNVTEYATRDRYLSMRGGDDAPGRDTDSLYGVSAYSHEHEDSYVPTEYVSPHLSTRYSPDRIGVQALRVSDGVFQDPYTNKVYDYNEGFRTEDGRDFPGGSATLQSGLMRMSNHLDGLGLVKEADYLDALLKQASYKPNSKKIRMPSFLRKELIKLATYLDEKGLAEEADIIDGVVSDDDSFLEGADRPSAEEEAMALDGMSNDLLNLANKLDADGVYKFADLLDTWVSDRGGKAVQTNT